MWIVLCPLGMCSIKSSLFKLLVLFTDARFFFFVHCSCFVSVRLVLACHVGLQCSAFCLCFTIKNRPILTYFFSSSYHISLAVIGLREPLVMFPEQPLYKFSDVWLNEWVNEGMNGLLARDCGIVSNSVTCEWQNGADHFATKGRMMLSIRRHWSTKYNGTMALTDHNNIAPRLHPMNTLVSEATSFKPGDALWSDVKSCQRENIGSDSAERTSHGTKLETRKRGGKRKIV